MYPDFLEIFGLDLYGLNFERALWLIATAFAGWGLYGGVLQVREEEDKGPGVLRIAVSVGLALFALGKAWQAWTQPSGYDLLFEEEVILRTYALAIVTGFVMALWVAAREGRRVGIPASFILDMSFWCLIFGMLGARMLDTLVTVDDYIAACSNPASVGLSEPDCWRAFRFWEGGLTFYGAFLGAVPVIWWYTRKARISLGQLMDIMTPSLALGHAFGRLGCLGAGCCWGQVCTSGWGLTFQPGEMPYDDHWGRYISGDPTIDSSFLDTGHTAALHPTQLYESFGELAIFAALLLWRPWKKAHGEVAALWMTMYGFYRVFTETMRGDKVRGHLIEWPVTWLNNLLQVPETHITFLSTSQVIGLSLGFTGLALFYFLRRRAEAGLSGPAPQPE